MKEKLVLLKKEFDQAIEKVSLKDEVENIRISFLGKKGSLTSLMKEMRDLSVEMKKEAGQMINEIKKEIETEISNKIEVIKNEEINKKLSSEWEDITFPVEPVQGTVHPISIVQRELEELFTSMGFEILDGPEMENEYNNFNALNIPDDHPARDTQDTFWLRNGMLLRTHTSPVQIRGMEGRKPPFKFIAPGKTYRNEATDACHEHTFHQIEGMVVDKGISIANLVYTLKVIVSNIFGREVEVRLRPSYFPFVEPGFELDFRCQICGGKGCPVCKQTGWIEYLGCGMIHPNVLKNGGIDSDEFQGFAFGGGIERLVMMKYGINDIRHFHGGDLRFLKQF
jgi:phenylalanyl-tRNA synthetase alpha chain